MHPSNYFASQRRVTLRGSEKQPLSQLPPVIAARASQPSAQRISSAGQVDVTVLLRRKQAIEPFALTDRRARVSREDFGDRYGADPASMGLVEDFAREFGLTATPHADLGRRTVTLSGTMEQMQRAFGVTLSQQQIDGNTFRVRQGSISLPEELDGIVVAVLGLDNRPQAKPHSRAAVPHASNISFAPVQVAQLYGFPAGAKAPSQTIGIIELGGGFSQRDLATYFEGLNLPVPNVVAVSVDGGVNTPGTDPNADGEVMLDIEVSAAIAVGAKIAVYFAPNTDRGFVDAIATAVHDSTNKPSVISISWGGPESTWTPQASAALDAACQSAAVLGVTITVACGDNGSTDGVADGRNHVDFPASSPHVLACGGTKLMVERNAIHDEVVWNELARGEGATGGGVSALFSTPPWQQNVRVPPPPNPNGGRGVPDVAGDADPTTGYRVLVDGKSLVIGGTSAVAPLWAGLIALANQVKGDSAGFVNPALYAAAATAAFRDITKGDNPAYKAGPGWDPCTGLGTPNGRLVIQAVAAS
jgi:kumamolisin